ncbi:unnamed protein product, partial [Prorocentrum cordatum]
ALAGGRVPRSAAAARRSLETPGGGCTFDCAAAWMVMLVLVYAIASNVYEWLPWGITHLEDKFDDLLDWLVANANCKAVHFTKTGWKDLLVLALVVVLALLACLRARRAKAREPAGASQAGSYLA